MAGGGYRQVRILTGEDLGGCPDRIKILPVGQVRSEKGDFTVDRESFTAMKAEMQRRGIDIVIDYEHQTLKDVQAPAGGWVKELIFTPGAIEARVEWTPKAEEYLKNKEYRYLSPVVLTRKADNKAVALHSIALTNTPAINGMFAIVNSIDAGTDDTGGNGMDLQKIRELLGLPADAAEEAVMSELLKKLGGDGKKDEEGDAEAGTDKGGETQAVANSVILGLLGLPDGARTEDVAGKIMALKAGADSQRQEIADALDRIKDYEAEEAVMTALKAGKITAAQKDWAKAYALKDRTGFDSFVDKAPVVVPVGKLALKDAPKKTAGVDSLVLKATGMSKEDIEKYADKEDDEE